MNNRLTSRQIGAFHRALARWYAAHGRHDLPWRNTRDPYAIYVSEIMLQQTQVKTVLERYYFPFLARFPTIEALASANQKEVLRAWQGLGYYNRAVNLHKAAHVILSEAKDLRSFVANAPQDDMLPTLLSLPGIGRNTAHAIAAFAFRQPAAVLEANVKRVVARIFALENPKAEELWERAAALLDTKNPFDYNQAMMDLGAIVCTPRAPSCSVCPARDICRGKDDPEVYPAPKKKKETPVRTHIIIVRKNATGRYFASPRRTAFLRGLYAFSSSRRKEGRYLGSIRQAYSHFTLEADVYLKRTRAKTQDKKNWHTPAELKSLPMSAAEQKILGLLALSDSH